MNKEEFDKVNAFRLGELNKNYSQYFIGNSYLQPLTNPMKQYFWLMKFLNPGENTSNEWYEPVSVEEYNKLN